VFSRVLGLAGLALVLVLFLALIVSSYSLTPGSAKLGLALVIAILAGALVMAARRLAIDIRARHRRQRGAR
jgi:hypothetical protein